MKFKMIAAGLLPMVLAACSSGESTPNTTSSSSGAQTAASSESYNRWYAFQHVSQGGKIFQDNCAACHGKQGEGAPNWKTVGADGKYPAPPLNGTGHAWHHPLRLLFQVVKNGSPGGQGNMPAWAEKLSDDEMVAAIAWFQSKWPDRIYAAWIQRELASRTKDKG